MLAKALLRYLRISPRKVGYVIAPIRRRTVSQALRILAATNRRAAKPISKTVASAFANARKQHPTLQEDEVIISRVTADEGPTWKRFRAAAFGRAAPILKRTTHLTVELETKEAHRGVARSHGTKG